MNLSKIINFGVNSYQFTIFDFYLPISVLAVHGRESLNQPWRYEIVVTSSDKQINADSVLSQQSSLTFQPGTLSDALKQISSLTKPAIPRTLYGVVTEFSQIAVHKAEAHYRLVLEPRLARLGLHHYSAIYQNQSVVSVVEAVLRKHGFTGVDYRLELNEAYPPREFITQWQESDLAFIQRILADIGLWLRFESHSEHGCDVLVISDYEQGVEDVGSIIYKQPTGTLDAGVSSVWDLQLHSKTVEQSVLVQDYNYRQAETEMQGEVNSQPKDSTTHGTDYRYGEHYKSKGDEQTPESGLWYAKIRHQQQISTQQIITGKSNQYSLSPGQKVRFTGHPLSEPLTEGVIILSVDGQGNRTDSYELSFTAIPFDVLKPYRPPVIALPQISGTLPARITSPDNDTYGYIDTHGRYRVKLDFDLKSWKNGEESLWLRLAKPYAGDTYGFHFPLIDGTEVALAFTGGDPNRPYIAHALHDSTHPDHVTTANKHRNVIRTPANNKLRMDDKRGEEHIKLATEYGKTQLNLGHLVDSNKQPRGEGFELRTDEWGAIAANQGLYLTTSTEPKAEGKQLDMQGAITQLENALSIAKALQSAAQSAQAHPADTASQEQLKAVLTNLSQSGLIAYVQEGIGLTSPENIQLSTQNSVSITAENHTDISVLKKITLAAGEALSLFAHKMGIKLFASKGNVEIQAQNDAMALAAKQDINIDSVDGSVTISAAKGITLPCSGSYIQISSAGIELGSSKNVTFKCNAMQKMPAASLNYSSTLLSGEIPDTFTAQDKQEGIMLYLETDDGYPIPTTKYIVHFENGELRQGRLDREGKVVLKNAPVNMEYAYTFPDSDDILAKANAQRLHKAMEIGNANEIVDYLSFSKEIVVKTRQAYKDIYQQDPLLILEQSIGQYNNKKTIIDYLLAKAEIIK